MISSSGPSLNLGKIADIPVKIHWSFSLLIFFIGYIASSNQVPTSQLGWFFMYIVMLFIFVIMHEFGHALMARNFGISTRDIILSPIGGIARLERLPDQPRQELLVALAGPAVNVVLAAFFLIIQLLTSDQIIPSTEELIFGSISDFIGYLLLINIALVVFNMLPAFPMDGGRVLRSLLSMKIRDRLVATRWAVWIGQGMALLFIIAGMFWDAYMLLFIGIFVFLTARFEYRQLKLSRAMKETYLKDVLRTEYTILAKSDTIDKAAQIVGERNFFVANDDGELIGSLPEIFIQKAIKEKNTERSIGSFMSHAIGRIQINMNLAQVFEILNRNAWSIAMVYDENGNRKGVVDRQLLMEFIRTNR